MSIFSPVFFASFRQPCFVQGPLLHHTDGGVTQLNRRKSLHGDLQVKVNVYLYVWVWVVELLAKVVCFCTKLLLFLGLEHFAWGSKIVPSQECKAFLKKIWKLDKFESCSSKLKDLFEMGLELFRPRTKFWFFSRAFIKGVKRCKSRKQQFWLSVTQIFWRRREQSFRLESM